MQQTAGGVVSFEPSAADAPWLEIAHPEKLSGLRPVKFEQLEARVHLNTVTWTYSRLIGNWL